MGEKETKKNRTQLKQSLQILENFILLLFVWFFFLVGKVIFEQILCLTLFPK